MRGGGGVDSLCVCVYFGSFVDSGQCFVYSNFYPNRKVYNRE